MDRTKSNNSEDGIDHIDIDFLVYSGMKGSIGLLAVIPENLYELLLDIQERIIKRLPKTFGYDYNRWRGYKVNYFVLLASADPLFFKGSCIS